MATLSTTTSNPTRTMPSKAELEAWLKSHSFDPLEEGEHDAVISQWAIKEGYLELLVLFGERPEKVGLFENNRGTVINNLRTQLGISGKVLVLDVLDAAVGKPIKVWFRKRIKDGTTYRNFYFSPPTATAEEATDATPEPEAEADTGKLPI